MPFIKLLPFVFPTFILVDSLANGVFLSIGLIPFLGTALAALLGALLLREL